MITRFSSRVDFAASGLVMARCRHPLASFNSKEDKYLKVAPGTATLSISAPEGGLSQGAVQIFEITSDKSGALSAIN